METLARNLDSLEHVRVILLRVTEGLDVDALDFQAFPDSKTIGEILLHIAGFEFAIGCAARRERGGALTENDHRQWAALKPGFGREAGFAPPRAVAAEAYREAMSRTREKTVALLREGITSLRGNGITLVGRELGLADTEPADRYDRLVKGLNTSFSDDGAPDAEGTVDLVQLLALHETYHRGQVTLSKYIRSRLTRAR